MADYNLAVLEAANVVQTREEERAAMLSEWVASGAIEECATRAVNRLGTEECWAQGLVTDRLADTFQRRLGLQLNDAATGSLKFLVAERYDETQKAIELVKIQSDLIA